MPVNYSFQLTNQNVAVWQLDFTHHRQWINVYKTLLNKEEMDRANRFLSISDQESFIITRANLRLLLSQYLKRTPSTIQFTKNKYGKLALLNEKQLQFNLSHSGSIAVFAFSLMGPVGIDVERIKNFENYFELAQQFFAVEEISQLSSINIPEKQREVFFNIWTRKEAFVKAIGKGLSFKLDQFAVNGLSAFTSKLLRVSDSAYDLKDWQVIDLNLHQTYKGALVCVQHITDVEQSLVSNLIE